MGHSHSHADHGHSHGGHGHSHGAGGACAADAPVAAASHGHSHAGGAACDGDAHPAASHGHSHAGGAACDGAAHSAAPPASRAKMLLAELDGHARAFLTARPGAANGPLLEVYVDADDVGTPLAVQGRRACGNRQHVHFKPAVTTIPSQEASIAATLSDGMTTHSLTFEPAPASERPVGEAGASKFVAKLPAAAVDGRDLTVTLASLTVSAAVGALEVVWTEFAPREYAYRAD